MTRSVDIDPSGDFELPAVLNELVELRAQGAVVCDFDGTLAPIVADPDLARPLTAAPRVLRGLSERFGVVAVVSGRPVSFLAQQLSAAGGAVHLVGVYGFEWLQDGTTVVAPEGSRWLDPAREILQAARASAPSGMGLEDKGPCVTLHWRRDRSTEGWARDFANHWARKTGMLLQPGRMAIELRPPVEVDKGRVLERLAQQCRAACFFGDDSGDIAAFDALDRMAERGIVTARVAVADAESPDDLIRRADVVVEGPRQSLQLLEHLARVPRKSS